MGFLPIPTSPPPKAVTANYTLLLSDVSGIVEATSASAITVTMPTGFPAGAAIEVYQGGAGTVTFVAGTSATRVSRGSVFGIAGQYGRATAVRTLTANEWNVVGDLA